MGISNRASYTSEFGLRKARRDLDEATKRATEEIKSLASKTEIERIVKDSLSEATIKSIISSSGSKVLMNTLINELNKKLMQFGIISKIGAVRRSYTQDNRL